MQDQKSLTLCRRSFLGGSSNIVTAIFAHKGGQYCNYVLMSLQSPVIIQDARHRIVDAPLTLICRMGQWACCFPVYVRCRPILPVWKDVTMQPFHCWKGETRTCWRSVDTQVNDILTVIGCSSFAHTMHIAIIDSQYIISMYNHFHPKASRPLCFWATTTLNIWAMNDVGLSHCSAFGCQFKAYRTIH